jgi:hypothetical protein
VARGPEGRRQADPVRPQEGWPEPIARGARGGCSGKAVCARLPACGPRRSRIDRKAHRAACRAAREELAELEVCRQRFHAGLPIFDDVPPPSPLGVKAAAEPREAPAHGRVPLVWEPAPAQLNLDDRARAECAFVERLDDQKSMPDLLEAHFALLREHGIVVRKADIATLARAERLFVERLDDRHPLAPETVERAIKLFRRLQSFCDRGEAKDMRRRERLERAYEEWQKRCAVERTAAMIEGVRERGERLRSFAHRWSL